MDDGGGAMISWEALSLIKDLGTDVYICMGAGSQWRKNNKEISKYYIRFEQSVCLAEVNSIKKYQSVITPEGKGGNTFSKVCAFV